MGSKAAPLCYEDAMLQPIMKNKLISYTRSRFGFNLLSDLHFHYFSDLTNTTPQQRFAGTTYTLRRRLTILEQVRHALLCSTSEWWNLLGNNRRPPDTETQLSPPLRAHLLQIRTLKVRAPFPVSEWTTNRLYRFLRHNYRPPDYAHALCIKAITLLNNSSKKIWVPFTGGGLTAELLTCGG